tara:strand:- start:140 stop:2005 length:1866 start_codon:yes stop_codon:yes gene_type:complete
MNNAGSLWIFCVMFLILGDIIGRELFFMPIRGVAELVAYSLVGAVFLQLAHALYVGGFTRAEMLILRLENNRPIAAALYNFFFNLTGVIIFAMITYGAYNKLIEAWPDLKFGVEDEFTILVWPLRFIAMIGAVAVVAQYFYFLTESGAKFIYLVKDRGRPTAQPVGWPYLFMLLAVAGVFIWLAAGDFDRALIGAFTLIGMLVLVFLGVHIGVALILLGFIGISMMMGDTNIALKTVKLASNEFLRNYYFGVIPLFVLMGLLINESDIGEDTFNVARWVMRPIKGGVGVATVAANSIFAAITGSSIASAAVFTKVATPHMIKQGYTPRFAVGTVAGSSVLGMLIPPSLLLIIYGFVAEQSVGLLFLAAILPGLLLASAMSLAIVAMAHFWPSFVGVPSTEDITEENIASALIKILPILILVVIVLGGIYAGFFTPVEAGAVGAFGALITAIARKRLTWKKLWNVLIDTGHTTVAVLFLILAANIYARMLALSGLPQQMGQLIVDANLEFAAFMVVYILMLIVLGMFLDSISIMLIVLPLVLPIAQNFGSDLIWFGIITVIAVEMGLLTPPLGIACYVVRSTLNDPRISLKDIFAGAFPFVVIMLLVTIILIIFPSISLVFI